jgi:hypothetical protein
LNCTGLTPAPKPPPPFAEVRPSKLMVPIPVFAVAPPICEPVAPPADIPRAEPKAVSINPELPEVVSNVPVPMALETPNASPLVTDPMPPAVPPPFEVPKVVSGNSYNFLDPLRRR